MVPSYNPATASAQPRVEPACQPPLTVRLQKLAGHAENLVGALWDTLDALGHDLPPRTPSPVKPEGPTSTPSAHSSTDRLESYLCLLEDFITYIRERL
jgi:hypothetical protein